MRPAPKPVAHRITAQGDGDVLDLFIFDEIHPFFGVDAARVVQLLKANENASEIVVHINSPGGIALDGVAIYNALVAHSAKVTVVVEGMALSAASIIAQAGDERRMAAGSQMMVHDARGQVFGEAKEMRSFANLLDATSGDMAAIYAARTGRELHMVRTDMIDETFMSADEAVALGYADVALEAKALAAKFDLTPFAYSKVPDAVTTLCSGRQELDPGREMEIAAWGNVFPGETMTFDLSLGDVLGDIETLKDILAQAETKVQTLIFDKEFFSRTQAVEWASEREFSADKVDSTEESFRLRQRAPGEFKPESFRTITLTKGVKAVIGRLKKEATASNDSAPVNRGDGAMVAPTPIAVMAGVARPSLVSDFGRTDK